MQQFISYMKTLKRSEATITKRVQRLELLRAFLGDGRLLDATTEQLRAYQSTYAHLAPASVHIYTRHITAFYRWARRYGYIDIDPAVDLELPSVPKAIPHPTSFEDMRTIFACVTGRLRTAYVLAAFAGLRCGEICRFRSSDISYDSSPTALIHGKGGKERRVPLLSPVITELGYRKGWVVARPDGHPCYPHNISGESTRFMQELGIPSTLHSLRAAFATNTVRLTHDVLLVRDLLGHESVKTTEIYMESTMIGAHERLAGMTDLANGLLVPRHLAAVSA